MTAKNNDFIHMRVNKIDKDKYYRLALKRNKTLSELIKDNLDKACAREGIKQEKAV